MPAILAGPVIRNNHRRCHIAKNDGLKNINWIIIGDGMSRKWLEDEISKAGLSDSFYLRASSRWT